MIRSVPCRLMCFALVVAAWPMLSDAAAADGAPAPSAAAAAEPKAAEAAVPAGISLKEDSARWESGYGEKFYQVVGTVKNDSKDTVGAVLIRTELVDESGKVVATVDAWNGRAEALGDLSGDAARAELKVLEPGPIEPGSSDRFRATFIAEETPKFTTHRVHVIGTLPPA